MMPGRYLLARVVAGRVDFERSVLVDKPDTAGAGTPAAPAPGEGWLPPWLFLAGTQFSDDRDAS